MNRYAMTLGALTAAAGALLSLQASAAPTPKFGSLAAANACQGALPNYEGSFRKRPLAVVNQGSTGAFLTCGASTYAFFGQGPGNSEVGLYVTNRTAIDADISCTMVDGLVGGDIASTFANYYPQTLTVAANNYDYISWSGSFSPYGQGVSCNVPASWEVNRVWVGYSDEIGS